MRIGVVACDMMKRELEKVLPAFPEVGEVVWLQSALHVNPQRMKGTILAEIEGMRGKVDAVFLGFGFCQSLRGIEAETDIPVHLPQYDDCLAILMTPERYEAEKKREVGTWFMTPGWAEIGAELVIKELRLDRARKYGRDPMEMARRLFTHYRRGLYVDTGVGEEERFVALAEEFCRDFNLTLERTSAVSTILADELEKCRRLAGHHCKSGGSE